MRINRLILENFQGVKGVEFNFNGENASIYGDNATGKTTIFNAITWLLFDKPSTGAKGYTPKTNDENGGTLHNLNHSAEGEFILENGRIITLKKVYHEVYKKKRGSVCEELDGHTTDYFVDGVPTGTEREYTGIILSFCDSEKMKILTMPDYFADIMGWEARRNILLELCGDITYQDVIASNEELAQLNEILKMPGNGNQMYSVDEYKRVASAKRTNINKELQNIPQRIDEVVRFMSDVEEVDINKVNDNILDLEKQKLKLETEKLEAMSSDGQANAIGKQIAEAKTKLAESKASYNTDVNKGNDEVYAEIARIKIEMSELSSKITDTQTAISRSKYQDVVSKRARLIEEHKKVQSEIWDSELETCPTCKQGLPTDEVSRLRDEFNVRKSERMEAINARGEKEASKKIIEVEEKQLKELNETLNALSETLRSLEQQEKDLRDKVTDVILFESTSKYTNIIAEIESLEDNCKNANIGIENIVKPYDEKIADIKKLISDEQTIKNNVAQREKAMIRVAELEGQEKELAQMYEELEKGVYICECFIKAKVAMLTDKINSKFKSVSFRLFVEQQNGGIKEDCEVLIPKGGKMVPYNFANNASRINAGLEIIDSLAKHWKLTMPICVDNAESVTKLEKVDEQVIRLVVSENDKILRLELE